MSIEERLTEIFRSKGAGPFLFVGSGFSRRYLGLEDWKGLLEKYCVMGRPFEFYLAAADGDYPTAAKIIAQSFNDHWWAAEEYEASRTFNAGKVKNSTSALRIEIAQYLLRLGETEAKHSAYSEEVKLLSTLNVDGIITTNWDQFLEQLYPDYKTYIGQNELLFSNPQQVGEIYKIHGCASKSDSLILTSDDYERFNEKNSYLAAKLMTIFVEHPIVFLGYSISDENVLSILKSISLCVGKEHIEKLRQNLIFVRRPDKGEIPSISDTYTTIDGIQIPLVLVQTDDFNEIYRALAVTKRKIPARILRYCKEQLYELVLSSEPEKKLAVVEIDSIEGKDSLEFVVGVGVKAWAAVDIGVKGYGTIEVPDLIHDLLFEDAKFDANGIVGTVIRRVGRYTKYVPVFKYLHEIGIRSKDDYKKSSLQLDKWVEGDLNNFRVKVYAGQARKKRHLSIQEIFDSSTPENAAAIVPFLNKEKIELGALRTFLIEHEDKVENSSYASNFKKLAALYDRLRWGW